jgi:hypothetical protein
MIRADLQLWSNSPYSRFRGAQNYSRFGKRFGKQLAAEAPGGKWPFGMPTSINPWLLVMGISPGGGEHESDYDDWPLTAGEVHRGFGGEYGEWDQPPNSPSPFWRKVRKLCFGLIKNADSRLNREEDCLAVSGMLNLGTKNQGRGGWDATDPKIIKWIPTAVEMLKPRIVVLLGWKHLFPKLCERWSKTCFPGQVVHKNPDIIHPLNINRRYRFRIWKVSTSWGDVTVVLWPNHPSQCPFAGDEENWEKSIKQASLLLKKRK